MSKAHKIWTVEEDQVIFNAYVNNENLLDISVKLNTTEVAIRKRIHRIIETDLRKLKQDQIKYIVDNFKIKTYEDIARTLNVTPQTIFNTLNKLGLRKIRKPHITDETLNAAINLIKAGILLKDIPSKIGLKYGAMVNLFLKNNIKPTDLYTDEMKVKHKLREDSGVNRIYSIYLNNALRSNIKFELSKEDFKKLTSSNCHYCGTIPSKETSNKSKFTKIKYNGIDKKYPKEGYILENCVPCCWECNRIKSDIPYDKFLSKINLINTRLNTVKNMGEK